MSTKEPTIQDRLDAAVEAVAEGLERRGMTKANARETAQAHRQAILVGESGEVEIRHRGGSFGGLDGFVSFLYGTAPAAMRGQQITEEERLEARRRKAREGAY